MKNKWDYMLSLRECLKAEKKAKQLPAYLEASKQNRRRIIWLFILEAQMEKIAPHLKEVTYEDSICSNFYRS